MGQPAVVSGDRIVGMCAIHQIPSPVGAPMPGPPMPFSAPVTTGACSTVLVAGKPVLVVGAQGMCTPPHVGLHPSDPFMAPPTETGVITQGSSSVLAGGTPVAKTGSSCTACGVPGGTLMGTASTVLVGG